MKYERVPCRGCGAPAAPNRIGVRCDPCQSALAREYAKTRLSPKKARAKASANMKAAWARRKGETPEQFRSYAEIKWRTYASQMVARAVKLGFLPKLDGSIKCVDCDNRADRYEHRDYSRVIDVEPVCATCNGRRRRGLMPTPKDWPRLPADYETPTEKFSRLYDERLERAA